MGWLTKEHLLQLNFEKMNVNRAIQVFSSQLKYAAIFFVVCVKDTCSKYKRMVAERMTYIIKMNTSDCCSCLGQHSPAIFATAWTEPWSFWLPELPANGGIYGIGAQMISAAQY